MSPWRPMGREERRESDYWIKEDLYTAKWDREYRKQMMKNPEHLIAEFCRRRGITETELREGLVHILLEENYGIPFRKLNVENPKIKEDVWEKFERKWNALLTEKMIEELRKRIDKEREREPESAGPYAEALLRQLHHHGRLLPGESVDDYP
ncbi:MAG: hypothetical protein J7K68_00120 [Candidatus Diapherotrites archaeon]|nr:hypothetical protein [Candidatus Diapherotrites archaeon]